MAPREPSGILYYPPDAREGADGIGPELRSLVETYVSYLSGCDACVIEALRAARAMDGDPARLHRLSTWRRAPFRMYTDRERIALVWAEVVAVSGENGIGEALRQLASDLFSREELSALTRIVLISPGSRRLMLERTGGTLPGRRGRGRRIDPCGRQESCELCAVA